MTAPVAVDEAAARNRRALILLGAVLGAVLLLFLVTRLLGGGGDEVEEEIPEARPRTSGQATPRATTTTTIPTVESFEVFTTKNPFIPLRGPNAGSGIGSTPRLPGSTPTTIGGGVQPTTPTTRPPTGTTPTTARPGTSPGSTTPTTAGGGSTTPTTSGTSTEPRRGDRVSLQDVFVEAGVVTANVRVNDTVYRVREGQTFATSYRAVSLDAGTRCGRFVFGDDQFRLCRGEEVVK